MFKLTSSLLSIIAAIILLSACGPSGTPGAGSIVRGSGSVVSENRAVSNFNQVTLNGTGEVVIIQGQNEALTVEAEDNILPYLETSVQNGVLTIGFKPDTAGIIILPTQPVKFYLSVKDIVALSISDAGNIHAEQLDSDRLALNLDGAGGIDLGKVNANEVTASLTNSGDLQINELNAKTVRATLEDAGSCTLAGEAADANVTISDSGSYQAGGLQSSPSK